MCSVFTAGDQPGPRVGAGLRRGGLAGGAQSGESADSGEPVTMPTLIHAIQREYQKLGRLTLASEFGPYLDLLRGDHGPGR